MIRVLVADDQAVVRGGLRMILESQAGIAVVGEAADGREVLRLVPTLDPDVVLMDIRMPLLDGIEATRRLCESGARARVLVLTTYGLDEYVYEPLKAGAAGFLLKTESPQRLIEAVPGSETGRPRTGKCRDRQRALCQSMDSKRHVARVLSKLGLRDRVQAVVFAYECGLIQPGQPADASTGTT